jgi:hypothetical protein
MRNRTRVATLAIALLPGVGAAIAQPGTPRISGSTALETRAKIRSDSARAVARATVPGGRIQSGELEEENGKLIYSFDIEVPGKSGVDEVHVDAMTGAVLAHEHESPADEKKEAAQQAREKAARKPAARP